MSCSISEQDILFFVIWYLFKWYIFVIYYNKGDEFGKILTFKNDEHKYWYFCEVRVDND